MDDRITIDLHEGLADVRLTRADNMNALAMRCSRARGDRREAQDTKRRTRGRAFGRRTSLRRAAWDTRNILARWPADVRVWREIPVPVIAAVHGVAFGGGFQLCLGADMRFVGSCAQLSVMEIKWAWSPT